MFSLSHFLPELSDELLVTADGPISLYLNGATNFQLTYMIMNPVRGLFRKYITFSCVSNLIFSSCFVLFFIDEEL